MPDAAPPVWQPSGSWPGIAAAGRHGRRDGPAGVHVALYDHPALALIIGSGEADAELDRILLALVGVAPPKTPRIARGGRGDLLWAGVDRWLLVGRDPALVAELQRALAGLAAVCDQSASRAALRLSGPKVRETLAKGFPIDLHPRAFAPGDTALTTVSHMGVQIWQTDATPAYELLVARSSAASFWSWLAASAAEFGCDCSLPAASATPSRGWSNA